MTVTEAQRALNLDHPDVVYRLLRAGVLRGEKIGRVWRVDEQSVHDRQRRVAAKRSSKLNRDAERDRRKAEGRALYGVTA